MSEEEKVVLSASQIYPVAFIFLASINKKMYEKEVFKLLFCFEVVGSSEEN